MKQIFIEDIEVTPKKNYSRTISEKGYLTPISRIDDYQTSISNFSTRNESNKKLFISKEKKHVKINPLITVVNIESFKKESYESINGKPLLSNERENNQKCFMCSIF